MFCGPQNKHYTLEITFRNLIQKYLIIWSVVLISVQKSEFYKMSNSDRKVDAAVQVEDGKNVRIFDVRVIIKIFK